MALGQTMREWGGAGDDDGCKVAGQHFYSTPVCVGAPRAAVRAGCTSHEACQEARQRLTAAVKRAVAACGGEYGARLLAEEAHEAEVPSAFAEHVAELQNMLRCTQDGRG